VYPVVLLIHFIPAAVILLASLALIVQVSLPYNKSGRASVLYNFILVFLRVFCGLSTLFKIPVIFKHVGSEAKVAILQLDLLCSGPVTHSGEILTAAKSHGKKPDRYSLNDDADVKKISRFKYATWNIRGPREKGEELD
jgi:hypothetical protein